MFETLFRHPTILERYRTGPHADSRERFLRACAKQGYSRARLLNIAWITLAAAPGIDLNCKEISLQDIESAVDQRRRFKGLSWDKDTDTFRRSRRAFVHIITKWLESEGCVVRFPEGERPFAQQLESFACYLRQERGLSPITVSTRCYLVGRFFAGLPSCCDSLRAITITDIDAFIKVKGHQGWARTSLSTLTDSLRSFFRYAGSQDWCTTGLASSIELPRIYVMERIPQGPAWEDVQRLLSSADTGRNVDIRDRAVLLLLALYGLRRGEVAALRIDDLDWVNDRILVTRPKQRCAQSYPLVPEVGNAILRYLREVRPQCVHRALFLTLRAPVRPLSAGSMSEIARARLSALGITTPHFGAHCLRHACAGHLMASGFSLKQIGDHLGHRSANSTFTYTKVDMLGLRQVAELDLGELL